MGWPRDVPDSDRLGECFALYLMRYLMVVLLWYRIKV